MRAISAPNLLEIWELGRGKTPAQRALAILEFALPQASALKLAHLSIGQRDAYLLRLRELTFGSQLKGLADCPVCHERLSLALEARDLYGISSPLIDSEIIESSPSEASFHLDAYEVTYRLLTSADLVALSDQRDATTARQFLLETCLVSVCKDGILIKGSDLPLDVLNALMEDMAQSDPLANLTLLANCPACGHRWQILFDIVSYLWNEINAWSIRLMREVHILASAYGWSEVDILTMSAWRRQQYLEMIGI
jgi:hypothetical protein